MHGCRVSGDDPAAVSDQPLAVANRSSLFGVPRFHRVQCGGLRVDIDGPSVDVNAYRLTHDETDEMRTSVGAVIGVGSVFR